MPKKQILECFPDDVQDVQSRIIIAHQLRASADIQDKQTKQETGWADTSDRATLMRRAADAIEALSAQQAAGEAVAYTGSGSLMALKDGREGFIWPTPSDAHPIPLYATPQPTETLIKRIEDGHADTEGEAAERFAHLNCPTCGGSGHIDDVQPTETQRIVAGLNEVRDLMLERIQGSPARSAAHNARVRLETIIRELSGEHLAGEGQ